ncbi:hypothetical protein JW905_05645 [bacterium]|nr:hypothetical protein [candidate division CSSED10-310 bacterium]
MSAPRRNSALLVSVGIMTAGAGLLALNHAMSPGFHAAALTVPAAFLLLALPGLSGWLLLARWKPHHLLPTLLVGFGAGCLTLAGAAGLTGFRLFATLLIYAPAALLEGAVLARLHIGLERTGKPERKHWLPWLVVMTITLILIAPPYSSIGRRMDEAHLYRTYFDHDFWVHLAVVQELGHGSFPPRNPYFQEETLHYYWLYFLVPAFAHRLSGGALSAEAGLRGCNIAVVLIFMSTAFWTWRTLFKSGRLAAILSLLGITCYSFEGVRAFVELPRWELRYLGDYNIDGLSRWLFGPPQIDGLYRGLLYTPQHLMALALLLVLLVMTLRSGKRAVLMAGLTIGLMMGFSGFIAVIAGAWYGLFLLVSRAGVCFIRRLTAILLFALTMAPFLAMYVSLGFFSTGSGSGFRLALPAGGLAALAVILGLNFGPLLPTALAGALSRGGRNLAPMLLGSISLFLLALVRMDGYENEFGLRGGFIFYLVLLYFSGRMLTGTRSRRRRRILYAGLALIWAAAAPTMLIDLYNSADTSNQRFTTFVTAPERAVLKWLAERTPRDFILQREPEIEAGRIRGNTIPPFAGRRVAAGTTYYTGQFQVGTSRAERTVAQVRGLLATPHQDDALDMWRWLDLDLLLLGPEERLMYGNALNKFNDAKRFSQPYSAGGYTLVGMAGTGGRPGGATGMNEISARGTTGAFPRAAMGGADRLVRVIPRQGFEPIQTEPGWIFRAADVNPDDCLLMTRNPARIDVLTAPSQPVLMTMRLFWIACPEAPRQQVEIVLGDTSLAILELQPAWNWYAFMLPSSASPPCLELRAATLAPAKSYCASGGFIGATGVVCPTAILARSGPAPGGGFYGDLFIHAENRSPHHAGYNLMAVAPHTGDVILIQTFDTAATGGSGAAMLKWVETLPADTIVAGVAVLDASRHLGREGECALNMLGCKEMSQPQAPAHAFIGVAGALPGTAEEQSGSGVVFAAVGPNQGDRTFCLALDEVRVRGAIPETAAGGESLVAR